MKNRIAEYTRGRRTASSDEAAEAAKEQLEKLSSTAEGLIRRYPTACLGVGLTLGVMVGWYIKRRG